MIPTCNARTKSTGKPCQRYPCKNGRCHLHGGKSTGPRTPEGKMKSQMANFKHGRRSVEFLSERKRINELIRGTREFLTHSE